MILSVYHGRFPPSCCSEQLRGIFLFVCLTQRAMITAMAMGKKNKNNYLHNLNWYTTQIRAHRRCGAVCLWENMPSTFSTQYLFMALRLYLTVLYMQFV